MTKKHQSTPSTVSIGISILLFLALTTAIAQKHAPETDPSDPEKHIQNQIEAIKNNDSLDTDAKERLVNLYETALKALKDTENFALQSNIHQETINTASTQLKEISKKSEMLASIEKPSQIENFAKIPETELEQRLLVKQGNLSDWQSQAEELQHELRRQNDRSAEISNEQNSAKKKREEVQTELGSLNIPASNTPPDLEAEARKTALEATSKSLEAEIRMLGLESIALTPRIEILSAQLKYVSARINYLQMQSQAIKAALGERRQTDAELFQEELTHALKAAAGKPNVIQEYIIKNAQLGNELGKVTDNIDKTETLGKQVSQRTDQIVADYQSAKKKLSIAGLSAALSAVLREQRRYLPSTYDFEHDADLLHKEIADASLQQFQVEDDLRLVEEPRKTLENIMTMNVDDSFPREKRIQIQAELGLLLDNYKRILIKLNDAYKDYLRALGDLDIAKRQMKDDADQFASFLDQRLLWIPSSKPINPRSIWDLFKSAGWILSPSIWIDIGDALITDLSTRPVISTIVLLLVLVLIGAKFYLTRKLNSISNLVSKRYADKFTYTLESLCYTLLKSLPLSLLMYFSGWVLMSNHANPEIVRAAGYGFCQSAASLFFLQTFYIVFQPGGIAILHFHWTPETTTILRRQLFWLRYVAIPAIFIVSMTSAQSVAAYSNSLGRFASIVLMLSGAITLAITLNPRQGALSKYFREHPRNILYKSRFAWYPLTITLPFIVIGFAVAGYYVSALELQQKLILSIRATLIAVILYSLVVRWLNLVNRQLAVKQAREKQKLELAAKSAGEAPGENIQLDFDQIDIPTINAQTHQVLYVSIMFALAVGFWIIWKDLLPAFSILDNVVLWKQNVLVNGIETHQPVTLTNLTMAILYGIIATIAVRNLPGVLEVVLLSRLTVEPGSRYAILQLSRYLLVAITVIAIADQLGGRWSEIQWLIAALGVGLGFGLQEIFANLVSGIILLFERPIRMGDTVTVGDMTGTVTRIQIRATTLTDWDRKELIVPNKTFITDKLTNWSLSDRITRIIFSVGIAYGSNTVSAHQTISNVIKSNPLIMQDPEPSVFFIGFGDSSLDFEVRVFVSEVSQRPQVTHELHMEINQALQDNNIEIPFPQRDIHIRSNAAAHSIPASSGTVNQKIQDDKD